MGAAPERRFLVMENEGSFFYQVDLEDRCTGRVYPLLHRWPPPAIMRLFMQELQNHKTMNPHEARVVIEYALRQTARIKRKSP